MPGLSLHTATNAIAAGSHPQLPAPRESPSSAAEPGGPWAPTGLEAAGSLLAASPNPSAALLLKHSKCWAASGGAESRLSVAGLCAPVTLGGISTRSLQANPTNAPNLLLCFPKEAPQTLGEQQPSSCRRAHTRADAERLLTRSGLWWLGSGWAIY